MIMTIMINPLWMRKYMEEPIVSWTGVSWRMCWRSIKLEWPRTLI